MANFTGHGPSLASDPGLFGGAPAEVSIYEVSPRDGLQNERLTVALADKIRLVSALVSAGLRRIEATSFVSPKWIPQLADADDLLRELGRPPNVVYSALCPNSRGLERAGAAHVQEIAVFVSASETHDTKKGTSNTAYVSELTVLKNYIKNRKANLLANAEVKVVGPTIGETQYKVNNNASNRVVAGDEVKVVSKVSFADGLQTVNLHYCGEFSGVFTAKSMADDGQNGDDVANDGNYTAILPNFEAGTLVRFYIEAIGNNTPKTRSYFPSGAEHQLMIYTVEAQDASDKTVVVNEFMASNTGIITDENGETEDK